LVFDNALRQGQPGDDTRFGPRQPIESSFRASAIWSQNQILSATANCRFFVETNDTTTIDGTAVLFKSGVAEWA
jgi:hypothetical protein